ncbi:MAG: hypothetical protein WAQ25_03870 [Candidatus Saccharimonas sp.]
MKNRVLLPILSIVVIGLGATTGWQLMRLYAPAKKSPQASTNTPATPVKNTLPVDTSSLSAAYDDFAKNGVKELTADKKSAVLAAYQTLSQGFSFTKNTQFDAVTLLHIAGISYLYATDKAKEDIYKNQLYLLTTPYLDTVPTGVTDTTFTTKADEAAEIALLEKYNSPTLSSQVLASPHYTTALTQAAKNLQLTDTSKLSQNKIIVFDFDHSSPRFVEFTKQHPMYGASPMMWVERLNNVNYIVMMRPFADELLAGKPNSLLHELIHGNGVYISGETARNIEERRAELFSGDESEYYESKQLGVYITVFGGIDMTELMKQNPTNPTAFYTTLYSKLGIRGSNGAVFSWPSAYLNQPTGAMKVAQDLKGMNVAILEAITIGKQDESAMNQRIEQRYAKLLSIFGSKEKILDDLKNNVGDRYQMPAAAEQMTRYAASK